MSFTLTFPEGYAYPAAIALGLIPLMSFGHGIVTSTKRRAAGIKYPHAYASPEQAKDNKAANAFNCAQRAHAQFLENMPQTVMSILFAGAFYPQSAAILASAWVFFRILYAYGYVYSDKPHGAGRYMGLWFYLAQGGLWGQCLYAIYNNFLWNFWPCKNFLHNVYQSVVTQCKERIQSQWNAPGWTDDKRSIRSRQNYKSIEQGYMWFPTQLGNLSSCAHYMHAADMKTS